MTSAAPTLLGWAARSIGPRVGRLLLALLLVLTLVGGLNQRLVAQLIPALHADADLRAVTLALIALSVLSSRRALAHALCPDSLAVLRRQPLGAGSFAALALPWAALLAWPWALVLALGHPDEPLVAIAGGALGALALCGVAAASTWRSLSAWTLAPLAAAVLVDRASAFGGPVLLAAITFGAWRAGRDLRAALAIGARTASVARARSGRVGRTPFGALLALDRSALRTSLSWLVPAWLPCVLVAYVFVLEGNGNCEGTCLDGAAILVTSLAAGFSVAVLDALRRVHGARLIAPDRVVTTRSRLASLFVAALLPLAPFALALGALAREPAMLPHACAVALAVLWRQLCDPSRAATLGPLVWTLLAPSAVVLLPDAFRFVASALVAVGLAALVDRRGVFLRAELAAARGTSARY